MPSNIAPHIVNDGVGLGAVIAVVVSWSRNRSILWAIFHGACSWLYVIYFALTEEKQEKSRPGLLVIYVIVALLVILAFIFIAQFLK